MRRAIWGKGNREGGRGGYIYLQENLWGEKAVSQLKKESKGIQQHL